MEEEDDVFGIDNLDEIDKQETEESVTELKRDEDSYSELVEAGVDKAEAAHIVNRIAEKRLKNS